MKPLLLAACISTLLYSGEHETAVKIMDRIVTAVTASPLVAVYAPEPDVAHIVRSSEHMYPVDRCINAALVLANDPDALEPQCRDGRAPLFMMSYRGLKVTQQAIGAFFWQKGRPNIIFLRPRLQERNITLPAEFDRYVEKRL